jgi:LysM repeat protein
MTATGDEPSLRQPRDQPVAPDRSSGSADAVYRVCPYLVSADGGWRSLHPTRDHRCGATQPPVPPVAAKQRDVCLKDAHLACATYVAAREVEAAGGGSRTAGFWPEARGTLLALEPARGRVGALPGRSGRGGGQAILIGLMVLAFLALVIARTTPPSSGGPSASVAGGVVASASPGDAATSPLPSIVASPSAAAPESPVASASPTTAPPPSGTPTAKPTPRPSATPIPSGATRYTVRSGDTLSGIAARFNTTVKKLMVVNGITDARLIHPGLVLVIP